jgi:hypothetical protein
VAGKASEYCCKVDFGSSLFVKHALVYMMYFYKIPVGVTKRADYFRARLVWQEDKDKRKYHLVKWTVVCQPKDQGGLGVINLEMMNKALLAKWFWILVTD